MLFWNIVKVGFKSLRANKLRSLLSMLGIIIGVGAVISILALGAGGRNMVLDQIRSLGTNLLIVTPDARKDRGVSTGSYENLKVSDAQAILDEVPGIVRVSPVVGGGAQVKRLNRNAFARISGVAVTWFPIRNFRIGKGRVFTEGEVEAGQRLAILGPVTAKNLFDEDEAVDQPLKIKGINFRVVGVLEPKGDQGWFNPDDQVLVPYTTAMKQLFGLKHLHEIDVEAVEGRDQTKVKKSIESVLRKRHRILEEDEDDFQVHSQTDMIKATTDVTRILTLMIGGIAGISLLVGGIGIMNIMLVTVTERTREIGIRKAIGAKRRSILAQFLIESVIISGLGGVLGVALGSGIAALVTQLSPLKPQVEFQSVLLSLAFAVFVGIFFGLYPARRASRLDPIDALRYE
ncbi:MAG: ABC transporter permease [Planctomycetota bacterium]|jgi:putative ABC transport system permease protein